MKSGQNHPLGKEKTLFFKYSSSLRLSTTCVTSNGSYVIPLSVVAFLIASEGFPPGSH